MTDSDLDAIRGVVRDELTGFATKDDLKTMENRMNTKFPTKDDLKTMENRMNTKFATKDDLKTMENRMNTKFPTKDDLRGMEQRMITKFPTKDDLKGTERRLDRKIDSFRCSNTQHHLKTREEIGYLNRKLGDIQEGLKQAASLI